MSMTNRKTIHYLCVTLLLMSLLPGCSQEEGLKGPTDKQPLDISVRMAPQTRTNHAGNAFVAGDSFELYEGVPSASAQKAIYQYADNTWTGNPGFYWDDLTIWNVGGTKKSDALFTGVLTNGGSLTLAEAPAKSSFAIAADQSKLADYLKNDLLIADASTTVLSELSLTFQHVMARLIVELTDNTESGQGPNILGAKTKLTIDKAIVGNEIEFGLSKEPQANTTAVALSSATPVEVTMLQSDVAGQKYTYEVILPAQSLRDATLTIAGNANQKVYSYPLSNVTFASQQEDILLQGKKTILKLKIEKTGLELGEVKMLPWVDKSASGTATPNDYPEIVIGGGGDDGEDDGGLTPGDDYAGKTIRLTDDVDLNDSDCPIKIPLGTMEVPFRGTFDGQGYTITGVNLDSDTDFQGIFGYTDGATIKNLNVEGTKIKNTNTSSSTATGGLAGYTNNTLISNCHVTYTEKIEAAYDNVGGLVGYANGTRIVNSSARAEVKAVHNYAGGLVGIVRKGSVISHCFAIKGATATLYYAGGLIGGCYDADVDYCYSWGNATANRYAGGLIGRCNGTAVNHVINCYAAGGSVTADANKAGLIGYTEILPNYCYWNVASVEGGRGFISQLQGNSNASFTLTTVQSAMGNICNGLNTDGAGVIGDSEWELKKNTDYNNYVLPVLKANNGVAAK